MSFYYMPFDYVSAATCYVISGLLDAVDGHAARYLNQCKRLYQFSLLIDTPRNVCDYQV